MLKYECKKIISNKFIIFLFAILFIVNALLSNNAAKGSESHELPEKVLAALEERSLLSGTSAGNVGILSKESGRNV